jgi:hypothetical protein
MSYEFGASDEDITVENDVQDEPSSVTLSVNVKKRRNNE